MNVTKSKADPIASDGGDEKRIQVMAASGVTLSGVEATLERPLSPQERITYQKAKARALVSAAIKRARGPTSTSERVEKIRIRHRMVELAPCADLERRKRLEADPEAWLGYYMARAFSRPFQPAHKSIIEGAVHAQRERGRFVVAAERGIGKSTTLWSLILYFALSGKERFPVCIMWAQNSVIRALRFWRTALAFNDRLLADYPEYCTPYSWARGSGFKIAHSLWLHTEQPTGALLQLGESMIIFPDNLGAIGCETINGNPRGLNHPCSDGSILRPTLALIDDAQSRGVASSPIQVSQVIEVIDGDIAGLGEAGRKLPMLLSGNCIAPYDVMHYYLTNPEWRGARIPRVISWPEHFADPSSATRKLWEEWNALRVNGLGSHDGGAACRSFYRRNKAAMIRGMKISNEFGFDKGQPDAFFGSMASYYTMGHAAFYAERQQEPIAHTVSMFDLTTKMVLSRLSGFPRLHAPKDSIIVMGIDINYVGFNWCAIAADTLTQTRRIVAHGKWPQGIMIPKQVTDAQACLLIRKGIAQFSKAVIEPLTIECGGSSQHVTVAGWDASSGKWQDAIAAAIRELRSPVLQLPLKAFGSKNYRPRITDLRQGKGWHVSQFPRIGKVLVINADHWRETMQRGFVAEPTEPGALSLYSPDESKANVELALQICGERLVEKVTTERGEYYTWTRTVGVPNDRADALVYACALSGFEGIGEEKHSSPKRAPRRSIHMVPV